MDPTHTMLPLLATAHVDDPEGDEARVVDLGVCESGRPRSKLGSRADPHARAAKTLIRERVRGRDGERAHEEEASDDAHGSHQGQPVSL